MKTLALVDADILVYQVSASNAKAGGTVEDLHWLLQATVDEWVEGAGAEDYRLYATFGDTFRHHYYPEYKQNRVGKPKPRGLAEARRWLYNHDKVVAEDGYEADDLIGMAATCPSEPRKKVIVSTDKDFLQIPLCPAYNPVKDTFSESTQEEADLFRLQQWVCGDSVDGYISIRNYGPKTFLKDYTDLSSWGEIEGWGYCKFEEKGYTEQYAKQMLVCATILQASTPKEHMALVRALVGEMLGTSSPSPSPVSTALSAS